VSTTVKFEWTATEQQLLAKLNLESGGAVQRAIDMSVIKYCEEYVPLDSGELARSPLINYTPGEVIYDTPYARYQFMGKVMGPNIPIYKKGQLQGFFSIKGKKKFLTGSDLKYKGAPKRGAFWFQRMKADHLQDIIKEAQYAVRK
jgi:hypothetical protein